MAIVLALVAVLVLLSALVIVAALREATDLRVTSLTIRARCIPPEAGRVRLVHLSDLHLPDSPIPAERIVEVVNGLQPDLVAITGDIALPGADWPAIAKALSAIRAPYGVFVVWGNAEHVAPVPSPWRWFTRSRSQPTTNPEVAARLAKLGKTLANARFRVLQNAHQRLGIRGARLALAGVDDPVTGSDDPKAALSGICTGVCTIVLSHSPMVHQRSEMEQADLVLAGHTHGGQIRLPVYGPLWAHSWAERRVASGLFAIGSDPQRQPRPLYDHQQVLNAPNLVTELPENGALMYVSRGIGTVIAPLRLNCPPEIVCIDLLPAAGSGQDGG